MAQQNYNENKPSKGSHPWEPPRRTHCHALAMSMVPRLPQQSPVHVFHEKLTKPEESEAQSIQMFVARLTKSQEKLLVRIRPHLAARAECNEATATFDDLARSHGAPFETLVDLAPMGLDVRKLPKDKGNKWPGQVNEGRRRLMEQTTLQHWLRRSNAVDTVRVQRVPSFEACTAMSYFLSFPEPNSLFAVRRRLSGWCPTGALRYFLHSCHGVIAATEVDNNNYKLHANNILI